MLKSRGYSVTDRRADNLIIIRKGDTENYFYIFGGKDERSQDLIQGITLAGVFFDEVALMPESFVNQATGRCSVEGSKFWFNCNPDGPYHWFKLNWIDKRKEKQLLYLHFTMDDNLSLSEKIKTRYRNMYTGVFYKRYILGLWAMAEGIIYDMFSEAQHVKDPLLFEKLLLDSNRYVSCDYGTQKCNGVSPVGKRNGWRLVLYERILLFWTKGRKAENGCRVCRDLENWLDKMEIRAIIVDPAAASFIAELRKRGFKIIKAKNDVEDGIRLVATKLNLQKIVFSTACINTIKEFASYIWDKKAAENGEDKPVKQYDHAMDAVRYLYIQYLGSDHG